VLSLSKHERSGTAAVNTFAHALRQARGPPARLGAIRAGTVRARAETASKAPPKRKTSGPLPPVAGFVSSKGKFIARRRHQALPSARRLPHHPD